MNWYKKSQSKFDLSKLRHSDNPVEQFLETITLIRSEPPEGYHYKGQEDFILQNGKHYTSNPMTTEELETLKRKSLQTKRFQAKQCFYNAQLLSHASSIKYVEGYLFAGILPIFHAWNTINGKVIDFTMAHSNNNKPILGEIPDGWDYFGVELPSSSIREYWNKHGESNALIDNYRERHPLLKEKFKPETPEAPEVLKTPEMPED